MADFIARRPSGPVPFFLRGIVRGRYEALGWRMMRQATAEESAAAQLLINQDQGRAFRPIVLSDLARAPASGPPSTPAPELEIRAEGPAPKPEAKVKTKGGLKAKTPKPEEG